MKAGARYKQELRVAMMSLWPGGVDAEHEFHPVRRWRFDFAVPDLKIAVEYNGHGQTGGRGRAAHIGRHAGIVGMSGDCEKLNAAQALGWRVIQFTALHFDPRSRSKHKLSSPLETLERIKAVESEPYQASQPDLIPQEKH